MSGIRTQPQAVRTITGEPSAVPLPPLGGWRMACCGWHIGLGPDHLDVLVAAGPRCWTAGLEPQEQGVWTWRWKPPHRRHYLNYSGPVSGRRGVFRVVWQGAFKVVRQPDGLLLETRSGDSIQLKTSGLAVLQGLISMR